MRHLNIYIRCCLDYCLLKRKSPILSRVLIKQKWGGGVQTIATYSISSVCECVTETDICFTFYAGLNDKQERGS